MCVRNMVKRFKNHILSAHFSSNFHCCYAGIWSWWKSNQWHAKISSKQNSMSLLLLIFRQYSIFCSLGVTVLEYSKLTRCSVHTLNFRLSAGCVMWSRNNSSHCGGNFFLFKLLFHFKRSIWKHIKWQRNSVPYIRQYRIFCRRRLLLLRLKPQVIKVWKITRYNHEWRHSPRERENEIVDFCYSVQCFLFTFFVSRRHIRFSLL